MSNSRNRILEAVRAAQPAPLPEADLSALCALPRSTTPADFIATLDLIGALACLAPDLETVSASLPTHVSTASTVPGLSGTVDLAAIENPHDLRDLHTAILPGRFGVCENGAIWLDEAALGPHRVLPFIAQHLVLVLPVHELVATMHDAYSRLGVLSSGFGLFIAGPSKTADIEQCLIIGAHGARSCTVWLLDAATPY